MKKLLFLAFAVLMVLSCMVGCKNNGDEKQKGSTTENDLNALAHIEQEDMGGYNFRILTRKNHLKKQVVDEETGETIEDAVYRRNEAVKAYFNIDITGVEGAEDSGDDALNSILAGDDQFDIIFAHGRTAFNYALQNTVVNFRDVSTIQLDKEWWYKDVIDSCEVNGYLYVLDGDISTEGIAKAATMFFNKRIFDELGLAYPYQLVLDDNWTFDEFSKLVKQGSKDLNGDGVIKESDDQFGFYTRDWYSPIFILYSGGQRIYSKDTRGLPRLSLNSPKTVQIYSEYFNLANSEDVFLQLDGIKMASSNLFTDGRAMFADGDLEAAKSMRSMNDDFGIVPFPKFSKEDKHSTIVNGAASLMVMPNTVPDYEKSGKIIEALCTIGSRDVIPAFYDVSLKTKFSRDYESEEMIDIVKDTLTYDLGYLSSGSGLSSTGCMLARQSNPDFAAFYAANESKAMSDLNTFISTYGHVG